MKAATVSDIQKFSDLAEQIKNVNDGIRNGDVPVMNMKLLAWAMNRLKRYMDGE